MITAGRLAHNSTAHPTWHHLPPSCKCGGAQNGPAGQLPRLEQQCGQAGQLGRQTTRPRQVFNPPGSSGGSTAWHMLTTAGSAHFQRRRSFMVVPLVEGDSPWAASPLGMRGWVTERKNRNKERKSTPSGVDYWGWRHRRPAHPGHLGAPPAAPGSPAPAPGWPPPRSWHTFSGSAQHSSKKSLACAGGIVVVGVCCTVACAQKQTALRGTASTPGLALSSRTPCGSRSC